MIQCHPPLELEELPKEDEERLEKLFSKIDTDGNGKIDIHDLSTALKELAPHINRSYAEKFLAKTGKDAGDVTLSEFIHYVREHEKNLKLQFSHLDKNKDGKVDLEELISAFADLGIAIGRNEATNLLKRMDQDGSLNISFDEWRDYLLLAPATDIHALIHFWRHSTTRGALASLKNYGVIFHNFFTSFHLFHFRHKSEYFMKMYITVHKISHYFTLYLVSISVVALFFFNLPSLYRNYKQGTFTERREDVKPTFAIYFEFPGMKQEDYLISLTVLNFWLSYSCSISVCLTDLILVLMVMQIIGHILVLNYNILNLPKPKKQTILRGVGRGNGPESQCYVELYDDEENADVHRRIGEFVKHHLFIVSFTDKVSEFFGLILALNYAFHLCSCCLLLLQCLGGNPHALARFGTIAVVIFGELIYTSVIFEVVGTVSEKLKDSVYEVPWECMNLSNQLSVCILLRRVQTPIHVTAMSLTVVGVQTMAKILKTTLSYFAFLRTMGE